MINIEFQHLKDSRIFPANNLIGPDQPIKKIEINLHPEPQPLPRRILQLAQTLDKHEQPGSFFNGDLANTTDINYNPDTSIATISTRPIKSFQYIAATNYFQQGERNYNRQSLSPVAPLSFEASIRGMVDGRLAVVMFQKSPNVSDFPSAYSQVSAAFTPEHTDISATIANVVRKKANIDTPSSQIKYSGIQIENLNKIVNITAETEVSSDQMQNAVDALNRGGNKAFTLDVQWLPQYLFENAHHFNPNSLGCLLNTLDITGFNTHHLRRDITAGFYDKHFSYTPGTSKYFPELYNNR